MIPTWLAWTLGIVIGVPSALALGIFIWFAVATARGENPFR